MAKQKIVWTVLPYGFETNDPRHAGALRASIVVSPRLTPQGSSEQSLAAFPEFLDWPAVVNALDLVLRFEDASGAAHRIPAKLLSKPSSARWNDIFTSATLVNGFSFADVSALNLRSYSVRNVMKFVRRKYEQLATSTGAERPRLLPWRNADPALKGMLGDLGVSTTKVTFGDRQIEVPAPGFDRFLDFTSKEGTEAQLRRRVFSSKGELVPDRFANAFVAGIDGKPTSWNKPIRALPPDLSPTVNFGFRTSAEYDFYQANRFYTRPENRTKYERHPGLGNTEPSPTPPEFDFHRIVASFSDFPQLLRELGLIIDVVLPKDAALNAILAALSAAASGRLDGALSVLPQAGGPHDFRVDAFPRTAFQLSNARFLTRPRTSELQDGLLALAGANDQYSNERSHYDVYQVDPDGAALKTSDFLLSSERLVARSLHPVGDGKVTYTTGDHQGVAALRSGSLGVSCHGRAAQVALAGASAALKNAAIESSARKSSEVLLFAEDVLRGYRVDVHTASTGTWASLCRRVGTYELKNLTHSGANPAYGPDEGYVKGASTTSRQGSEDHYLHESLFRWTGWSLVAPRPGRTLVAGEGQGPGLQSETVEAVEEVAAKNTGVVVRFKAEPGSLPRLRFGEKYRIRGRVVDLAGNSLDADDRSLGVDEQATDEVAYLRFEPVDPPALVQTHRLSEGESLERMVIRSNYNVDTTNYLNTPSFSAAIALPASFGFDYVATAVRHVVPPKSAQLQVETHGLLDAAFSGAVATRAASARAAYELVAQRESLSLFDVPGIQLVTPPSTANATSTTLPLALPGPGNPTGDRLAGGQYIVYPDGTVPKTLPTPYLPDDAACGIAIRNVPGVTRPMSLGDGAAIVRAPNEELIVMVVYSGKWPERTGLRIVVRELVATLDAATCSETPAQDPTPVWDASARELTIFVSKGRIERLRYSSFVFSRDLANFGLQPEDPIEYLDKLGIPAWISSAGARRQVEAMASVGCNWLITPDRTLTLVHATQQPVCNPQFLALSPKRKIGETHVDLSARLRMHGPSTGKFEVVAEWAEVVDDPLQGPPERVAGAGQLSEVSLPENFRNLFGLAEIIDLNEQAALANLPNPPPPGQPKKTRGDRHDFGDTKFRLVRYRIRATTRFREYLPASLSDDRGNITRLGDPVPGEQVEQGSGKDLAAPVLLNTAAGSRDGLIVVPNSARPASPTVVYVLPTFLWQRNLGAERTMQSSTRFGNGLRVYLERPWFSSGDGELLGIVITGDGTRFKDIPESTRPFVTQWGVDPLFDSVLPTEQTRVNDFPLRVAAGAVKLEETGALATVVGHRVQWDAERELWYCDIELNPGRNYMPFVRLALVRYQPHSIDEAHVSRVVLAEFAQLLPRRSVTMERSGRNAKFVIRGPAPEYGPMKTSQWQTEFIENRSFTLPPFGAPRETGRNRLEVVLQTRDSVVDSDLAWSDARLLASTLLDPPGAGVSIAPAVSSPGSTPARTVGGAVDSGALARAGAPNRVSGLGLSVGEIGVDLGAVWDVLQPLLWEGSVRLPAVDDKARLVVREFERFYGDNAVPDVQAGRPRRVINERLVYAEYFPLN